jgi:hypothetical protein
LLDERNLDFDRVFGLVGSGVGLEEVGGGEEPVGEAVVDCDSAEGGLPGASREDGAGGGDGMVDGAEEDDGGGVLGSAERGEDFSGDGAAADPSGVGDESADDSGQVQLGDVVGQAPGQLRSALCFVLCVEASGYGRFANDHGHFSGIRVEVDPVLSTPTFVEFMAMRNLIAKIIIPLLYLCSTGGQPALSVGLSVLQKRFRVLVCVVIAVPPLPVWIALFDLDSFYPNIYRTQGIISSFS